MPENQSSEERPRASRGRGDVRPGPRERLLATASRRFYEEGVHVVGIDPLIREAGVAKQSLYAHFGDKDGLVRAYLETHFALRRKHVAKVLARYESPRERLLGMFADAEEALASEACRRCRFVNASVEARPPESSLEVTAQSRAWLRGVFVELARDVRARDPEQLGRQLAMLYDGVAVAARFDSDRTGAGEAARAGAAALLDAAL